ncbi:serine/threonine-protein kinase [Nonomuraea sp. NPDC046570]|uniref:serine/threonine-protein kinase n=1 Tax=Nonomuraea sp. NPDC046570 TaxID=3155255 RepID=UPI0033D60320
MEWSAPGYTEVRQLGAGGSGRVVLAVHDGTGVRVAVKYLTDRDPELLARFRDEARLLAGLRDEHIARIWEYLQAPEGAAIVMELVNGVSLRALLREHGSTGPEAALVVLKGSLLGLERAHGAGLVHRDYKPENVIVRDDGVSKLVDFGIAVRQGVAHEASGTPPYMAPEQWSGGPASPATDVYAATAVFFECLTGHRPYRSTEPSVLGYQHLHAPIPVQDAPEPVRGLLVRGLAKDPAERPASAGAFVAELERVAAGAYGEEWEERGRRRLAALVALLAFLLPTPQSPPPVGATTLFRTVLDAMRGNARRLLVGAGTAVVAAGVAGYVLASSQQPPRTRLDIVAATPPATTAAGGLLPSEEPTPTASTSAGLPPDATLPPETSPPPTTSPPTTAPPSTRPPTTPPPTTAPPTTQPPSTAPPTTQPPTTPPPTTQPPTTPPPVTGVSGVQVGGLTVNADSLAEGRVTVTTTGTGPVTAVASFGVGGAVVHTERVTLRGDTSYAHAFSHRLGESACGKRVTLTVTTTPPAAGGAASATASVPPCPAGVTGLKVSLSVAEPPGRAVQARISVGTGGPGPVALTAAFAVDGRGVGSRSAELSGETSYTRTFRHAFARRPCGSTVSVTVRAGGEEAVARAGVTCPPAVRQVTISRAALTARGAVVAVVRVVTANDAEVRLSVAVRLSGETVRTQEVTLAGQTAYTRTVSVPLPEAPCGTEWGVTAASDPAAANGTATAGGRTSDCQPTEPAEETGQIR